MASDPDPQRSVFDAAGWRRARAEALVLEKDWAGAVEAYDDAIKHRPDYPEAWNGRGTALQELGEAEDALASFDQAIKLRPDFVDAHDKRGVALRRLNRPAEAVEAAERALALNPLCNQAYTTRAHALRDLGRIREALAAYEVAVKADPTNGPSLFNRGACRLLLGDFEKGWPDYECRWRSEQLDQIGAILHRPLWRGEAVVGGKRILLHAEQGIGDTIQFCRYADLVADLGATVVLGVPPPLRGLMASLRGAAEIVSKLDIGLQFDLQCPLLSLPLAFGTRLDTIPASIPYLAVPDEFRQKWRRKLGARHAMRIGLAWAGNPAHQNDHNRSMALEIALGALPEGVEVFCLQRDLPARDVPTYAMNPHLRYFGSEISDFLDVAALILEMDLVISVDTAILHLAGALGARAWALLAFAADWRWLTDRADTPWYPTMRLFRQDGPGKWEALLGSVRAEMEMLM